MNGMGRHTNGTGLRGDDGAMATLPPATISTALAPQRLVPFSLPWTAPRQEEPVTMDAATSGDGGKNALARWCDIALWVIAALIAAASSASFAESYRGLWLWARHHGLSGFWAAAFPAQIDVFIAVGEVALFVALARQWSRRSRIGAWLVTLAGLCVSVAGNIGHVASHDIASRLTAGVPPVAATAALAVGLGVLKRVVSRDDSDKPSGQRRQWFWQQHEPRREAAATVASPAPQQQPRSDMNDAVSSPRQPPRQRPPAQRKPLSGSDKVRDILKDKARPLSKAEKADVAKRAGVSVRTVERNMGTLAAAAPKGQDPEDTRA